MDKNATRERWLTMSAQAEHLATRDNTLDAVARARLLVSETAAALNGASSADRQWFEEQVAFAQGLLARMEQKDAAWRASVVARKEALRSREAVAYGEKVPGAPLHTPPSAK